MKIKFRYLLWRNFSEKIVNYMLYIMNMNFYNLLKKTTFTQNNIKNSYL